LSAAAAACGFVFFSCGLPFQGPSKLGWVPKGEHSEFLELAFHKLDASSVALVGSADVMKICH